MAWSPHVKNDVKKLGRIQRTATKTAPGIKDLTCVKILREMELSALKGKTEEKKRKGKPNNNV